MLGHKMSRYILKYWNHTEYLLQPKWNEAGNQYNWKTGKFTNMGKLNNTF